MLPPAPAVIRTACLLIPHKVLLIILIVGAAIIAAAGLGMWLHKRSTYRLLNFFAVHVSITSKLKSRDNESIHIWLCVDVVRNFCCVETDHYLIF